MIGLCSYLLALFPPDPDLWSHYRWLSDEEPACQHRRCGFNPWVGRIPWRRKWQPTSVFLPGKSYGQRSLVGYSPWDHKRIRHNEGQITTHTHTHLPLDPLAPWLPNIQISAQSAETQGVPMLPRSLSCEDTSWRFVWRCLIISNSLLSVCVTTWSVSPTLSGWQAHFARGQYHQPLSAWHINQDSWMNKWRWIPLSRFSTSLNDEAVPYPSFCLHLVLLFHVPALSHLCTLSQVPFLYEP